MTYIAYKHTSFTLENLNAIARLHQQGIPSGFLSSLGIEFLMRLYASIAASREGILIAAVDTDNQVIGFVSGTTEIRPVYKHLLRHNFIFLVLLFLKFIFSFATIKRILESKKYSASRHVLVDSVSAELLSIVVDARFHGKGIASGLFNALVQGFHEKNVNGFKIIVGSKLVQAQRFYLKIGAVKIAEIEVHQGERSFLYEYKTN
jgi:GNAT superfamily N-acetyltransferase